jgi:hypothetical protein
LEIHPTAGVKRVRMTGSTIRYTPSSLQVSMNSKSPNQY